MSYTCNLLHRLTCTSTGNRIFAWQIVLVDIHELHTELFSRVGYPFFFVLKMDLRNTELGGDCNHNGE